MPYFKRLLFFLSFTETSHARETVGGRAAAQDEGTFAGDAAADGGVVRRERTPD